MNTLVIVESPTKAKTLSRFLGSKYRIEASMGHIRDLPKGELGIDIDNNFEPKYIIPRDKRKKVNELKKEAKDINDVYLATDPDREGEAIAWHIAYLLEKPSYKRVVFHEITEEAIKEAFANPREIDLKLVDAQQARRVLDRLVGYKLSPLLWKKIKRGLSAGRVQSVALRLITEREREISKFVAVEYWSLEALLEKIKGSGKFYVMLILENGKKVEIKNEKEAKNLQSNLEKSDFEVLKITKKEVKRNPAAPFITSTLQQTAGNKLGLSAKKTMMLAQNLYEHGFITYMRTDSVNLSTQAIVATRNYIQENYGKNYLPSSPRVFKSKSKNAQEAHEAIRPTDIKLIPDKLPQTNFNRDHIRLYDLIWKRTLASQINEAILDQTTVDVTAKSRTSRHPEERNSDEGSQASTGAGPAGSQPHFVPPASDNLTLRATGSILKFDGWLKIYGISQIVEEDEESESSRKQILPELTEGEDLKLLELLPEQHFTQPPPRYTEASLIKKLEELGIGRPSTYAPILSTIQERFYVEREERKFIPTALGFAVVDFLVKYFPDLFDYEFTALMEDKLDDISRGEIPWKEIIGDYYLPLAKILENTMENAEKVELAVEVTDKTCPKCSKPLIVRTSRFGKFLACSGFPDCKYTESIEEKIDAKCPEDGGDIVVRKTKRGKVFYGCKNYPKCKYASWNKPKSESSGDENKN